jgi:hypothetical protein
MATAALEHALVLSIHPEIVGPGSEYEQRRLALKHEYDVVLVEAQRVTAIQSQEQADNANNLGRLLQAATKDADLFFAPIKRQIDSIKAPVLADEKSFLGVIEATKKRLGTLLTTWNAECERKRLEQERQEREAAERQDREEKLARAIELEQAGDVVAAAQVLDEPVFSPVVTQSVAPAKVAGQVGKVTYSASVDNLLTLVKAIAEGKAPLQAVQANESYINGKARLEKEAFVLPGCKLVKNAGTHFRA